MEKNIKEFESTLNVMDDILNQLVKKQAKLRAVVKEKNWEELLELIQQINDISNYFTDVDEVRDQMQALLSEEELKPFLPKLRELRSKLLKCKVESKVLSDYVNVTRQFIQQVIDKALPAKGNKNYSKNGSIKQPQLQSVLVDLRG